MKYKGKRFFLILLTALVLGAAISGCGGGGGGSGTAGPTGSGTISGSAK